MTSHAQAILELPAPKEVSMIWDLNLSASFSSQHFSRFTRSRDRKSATNTPSYRCCPGSLLSSSPRCATPPEHRSSPALNAVTLKVQIPMLQSTVWYLMTPWAPHRDSLISTIARLATLIQKRSGGLTSRGKALLEAREQILAKSMRATGRMALLGDEERREPGQHR